MDQRLAVSLFTWQHHHCVSMHLSNCSL